MRAAVAASVIALACLTVLPGDAPADAGLIRIFAVTNAVRAVDMGRPGRSAGDVTLRGAQLWSRDNRLIGSMALECTFLGDVLPGDASLCQVEYALPRGKIVAMGTRQRADYMVFAIVGGTGVYSRASGVLIHRTLSVNPRRERLFFSLES